MSLAVIVTYRRPIELARLLDGLAKSTLPLRAVVVVDHAADAETERLVHAADLSTVYLADASNPGPGVGWANGWRFGREKFGDAIERVWFLDDDVVIGSEVHGILVDEMAKAEAGAIAPLLEDNQGRLWGFPEPVDKEARRLIRRAGTPADALTLLGVNPLRFAWCTGACFLVSRQAVESAGEHRADFWMLGEDLEFSMRVATITKAVFTCRAVVPHLPGPASQPASGRAGRLPEIFVAPAEPGLSVVSLPPQHPYVALPAGKFQAVYTHLWMELSRFAQRRAGVLVRSGLGPAGRRQIGNAAASFFVRARHTEIAQAALKVASANDCCGCPHAGLAFKGRPIVCSRRSWHCRPAKFWASRSPLRITNPHWRKRLPWLRETGLPPFPPAIHTWSPLPGMTLRFTRCLRDLISTSRTGFRCSGA